MAAPASPKPPAEGPVRVSRTFQASRQRVYRAWTDPELLIRWFVEDDGEMRVQELDLRVGGRWRFEGTTGGKPWALEGTFRDVRPPERLVYTWKWGDDMPLGGAGDTLVTVEFRERGTGTEVTVTQEGFTSTLAREGHNKGWIGCLDRMRKLVEDSKGGGTR
jgi:uncharacterized protein YndB with AHSA1/START domain